VDIAEYAPGIVGAARTAFAHLNRNVLLDPAVKVNLEDGRNMLLVDRSTKYDLATIEVTSIWFAGATNVYSREFYQLVKRRLRPGGVLQQWVQLHHIGHAEIASAIATVRSAFPYVSFWYFGGQGMIVAADRPQTLDPARVNALMTMLPGYHGSIAQARVMSPAAVDRMIDSMRLVINSDHNRWIEYATPRYNGSDHDWRADNLRFLGGFETLARNGS
jgi:spermidine synthase